MMCWGVICRMLRYEDAFNQIVRNTDDHLRNHGFLLTEKGWRLSPMFDVNPNPDGGPNALEMGDLIRDADYYRMTKSAAQSRYAEIKTLISTP